MIFAAWLAFIAAMCIGVSGWYILLLIFTPIILIVQAILG